MAKQSGDPTYTLSCDNCRQPYLSQEAFPDRQLCPKCKPIDKIKEKMEIKCAYCPKAPDGAMLSMGNQLAHADCVIRKLNELLDPDYHGTNEPAQIVGITEKIKTLTLKAVGELISTILERKGSSYHLYKIRELVEALKRGEIPK